MIHNATLLAALRSHSWTQPTDLAQTCTDCGYRMPSSATGPGYRVVAVPVCQGAPADEPDTADAAQR